ncbi:Glutaminyl-tRNA synthetase [Hyphodiscus hymeniophilus]|uniref:glutamine--tRNA ligase n=1 Tax=Hyphodiscus hymeniophilus TaxID=353542 RepID=A0A9P6SPN3_9HELO|nr:Glutaminyl-tRNA synthetase [Hyphodiscus hymeniophilus]
MPPPTKDVPIDADSMFKGGFLADVYSERPIGQNDIDKVVTRFPPEPNGFLHLGHSKAILINFGFARFHGGDCYLRFDDTNPAGEEEKYFTAIEEMVSWLGFKPVKITHSSDNFDRLYELAEDLINRDGAYVCHCTKAEVVAQRGGGKNRPRDACPHRNRPLSESLTEFRAMRDGKYKPQEAVLRMKQNLEDGNPQMWDLAAYRVLDSEEKPVRHYRTGDKWKIYPTYDFTHCLCDSFEGITHSLCTTEFELSRVSYEWLCDKVEVYKPMQREFGRLNVSGTVLSKRKIISLIENGCVRDWDDPRLYTLIALRRRGVPPGSILRFVNELGVTKATTTIDIKRFERVVRGYLENTVPRLMLVLDPIPVVIENLTEDYMEMVELPFSKDPAFGIHTVPFTKTVYIERSDFRETASKDFFRLAPGSSVGLLKVPFPITATGFETDPTTGLVTLVRAHYEKPEEGATFKKPKTYIHWIADCPSKNSPINATVRIFNQLFNVDNPDSHPDGFLAVVNPVSEETYPNAMIETGFAEIKRRAPWPSLEGERDIASGETRSETVRFQGMRVAYFCLDRDSTDDNIVMNRIVSLKEDAKKA